MVEHVVEQVGVCLDVGFLKELFGLVIRLNLVPLLARSVLVSADLANVEIDCYFLIDPGGQLL